ncbi:SpoIIE family protein phosphatase [bacterium]|nr:SpoIIE family protein phosphatase [bacterium]MBU1872840.1 SpoIIE family protein phosphatase [bacterium]
MNIKKIFRPSLLKKFLIAFFVVAMVPLIIAEYFTIHKVEDELKSVLNDQYYLIIDQLMRTVDEVYIGSWVSNLQSTAQFIEDDIESTTETISTLLNAKQNQIDELIILILKLTDSGAQLSAMDNETVVELYNQDPEQVSKLTQYTDDINISNYVIRPPVFLPNSDKLYLPIEVPIVWEDGQSAVLRGVFNLNSILDFVSTKISIGAKELYIVNNEEQIVFSNNEKFISGDTLLYPIMSMVKSSLSGKSRMSKIGPFSYNDIDYLSIFAISQYVQWGIIVTEELTQAYAMVEQAKKDIVKWVGLAIILCVIFSILFARSFSGAMRYMTTIAKKIGGGEFDVKVKVNSKDELGQLGESLQEMAISLGEAVKVKEELFAIQAEVKIASRIQQSILPVGGPNLDGLGFGARYIPMEGVAGDFYDFHVLEDNCVGVLVADVSGHGIPAAMISTMVKVTFSQQSSIAEDASKVLNEMNRLLSGKMEDQFLTAMYLYVDIAKKKLITADAGHCPLYIWRRKDKEMIRVKPKGMIIGFLPVINCPIEETKLKDGDRLVMYTDGIVEAANPEGELFNDDRLINLISTHQDVAPEEFIDIVVAELKKWVGEDKKTFEDDLTMVVMDIGKY